jgi:hypothetical protein
MTKHDRPRDELIREAQQAAWTWIAMHGKADNVEANELFGSAALAPEEESDNDEA